MDDERKLMVLDEAGRAAWNTALREAARVARECRVPIDTDLKPTQMVRDAAHKLADQILALADK